MNMNGYRDIWDVLVQNAVSMVKDGRTDEAIDSIRWDVEFSGDMSLSLLLSACPVEDRAVLGSGLSGYLNRTPSGARLVATPVLLCVHPSQCYRNGAFLPHPYPSRDESFILPTTSHGIDAPNSSLNFLGWLNADTVHPQAKARLAKGPAHTIPWGKVSAALAVFEWSEHQEGELMPTVPDEWWGHLFYGCDVVTKIDTPLILDYTRASDAARAMAMGASRCFSEGGFVDFNIYYFTTRELQRLANFIGLLFREQCDEKFPEYPYWQAMLKKGM